MQAADRETKGGNVWQPLEPALLKKMKEEWKGTEVPIPGYAKNFLEGRLGQVTAEWSKDEWKKQ